MQDNTKTLLAWVTIFFIKFPIFHLFTVKLGIITGFYLPSAILQWTHNILSHELSRTWALGLFLMQLKSPRLSVTKQKALVKSMSLMFWFCYSFNLDVSDIFFCNKQSVPSSCLNKLICKSLSTCIQWVLACLHV